MKRNLKPLDVLLAGILILTACTNSTPTTSPALTPDVVVSPTLAPSPTPPPDARATAGAYLAAWQAGDYGTLYGLVASGGPASAADLEAEYRKWLEVMMATSVTAQLTDVAETGDTATATATVKYETALVGALEATLTLPLKREGGRWRVVFSPALIWPEMVNGQTLLMVVLPTERGNIYDRNGAPLAQENVDAYAIGVIPGELPPEDDTLPKALGRLEGIAPGFIAERYTDAVFNQYQPLDEAPAAVIDKGYSFLKNLPGVYLYPYTGRFYSGFGAAAQVTGYISFIQPDEVAEYRARGYNGSERVGRAGLEGWGEAYLAGKAGGQLQLRDADNKFIRMVAQSQPVASQDIYATIDLDLQEAAQFALGDLPGAIVVLDLHTGEVLALASSPTYSPNLYDPGNYNSSDLNFVLNDPGHPLLNHAAQATYPAGSIFKIVTMSAGLTSGLFTPDTEYTCTGEWNETNDPAFIRKDWKEGGHGTLTLTQGLSASCNPWFYHVGFALFNWDPRWLSDTARAFGLGQRTQDQIDEDPGLIPDPDWKKSRGETWGVVDSINESIGQGDVLVTPLQIARMVAAVGNGGTLYQLQLVKEVRPPDGAATLTFQPIISGTLPLTPEQVAALQEGMINVTKGPIGTARNRFQGFRICVAGKTGTAEDPGLFGERPPDAWFAGYTCANRADKPDIAVAVVVPNQGQGSDYAAPIFRRVLEAYFGLPYVRYPWEQAVGVPLPEATATPAGVEIPAETATPTP